MKGLHNLLHSPEWYPLAMDFERQVVTFIRLSREAYQDYVFLAPPFVRNREMDFYEVRLDDVLLAAASTPPAHPPVHYILHTAYCCSTLLARYFELVPGSIVLKEPSLLAQIAEAEGKIPGWQDSFELAARLLTRTYTRNETAVIKTHVPCNTLAQKLLEQNENATISFLMPPLRSFLLAVLKSQDRRYRVRSWSLHLARVAAKPPHLSAIDPGQLSEGATVAYWWLMNRFLCEQLTSQAYSSRVLALDSDRVANSPKETLRDLATLCRLNLGEEALELAVNHPTIRQHSKDFSRPYDAAVRQHEVTELEKCWGAEADAAIEWISSLGMPWESTGSPLPVVPRPIAATCHPQETKVFQPGQEDNATRLRASRTSSMVDKGS
jgi:hypothetical protein